MIESYGGNLMKKNLTDLSEADLLKKLQQHYLKVNKFRGPSIRPTFTNVQFISTKDGKIFLVGSKNYFCADYTYGKDEAHNQVGSTPHVASSSWTFAVMLENGHLTDQAFEITANAYETHITDYSASFHTGKTIKLNDRLMSEVPASTSIDIMKHQGDEHSSIGLKCHDFNNIADRRKILNVLTSKTKKSKPYSIAMKTSSSPVEWYSDIKAPDEMIEICADLISPAQKDIEAAQDYRHHLNTQKNSASKQNLFTKTWTILRSKFTYLNK